MPSGLALVDSDIDQSGGDFGSDLLVIKPKELAEAKINVESVSAYRILETSFGLYRQTRERTVSMSTADFLKLFNIPTSGVREIQKESKELMALKIQIPVRRGDEVGWRMVNLVEQCHYIPREGITLRFNEAGMELLGKMHESQLDANSSIYRVIDGASFGSVMTSKLFSLFAAHAFSGEYIEDIEHLREVLGIEEGSYKEFKHFKLHLARSIKRINAKGALIIDENIEIHAKTGNKAKTLRFVILEDNRKLPEGLLTRFAPKVIDGELLDEVPSVPGANHPLIRILQENGMTESNWKRFLTSAEAIADQEGITLREHIETSVRYYQERQKSKPDTKLEGSYLRKTIMENWAKESRSKWAAESKGPKAPQSDKPKEPSEAEKLIARQLSKASDLVVADYLESLKPSDIKKLKVFLEKATSIKNKDLACMFYRDELAKRIPKYDQLLHESLTMVQANPILLES